MSAVAARDRRGAVKVTGKPHWRISVQLRASSFSLMTSPDIESIIYTINLVGINE